MFHRAMTIASWALFVALLGGCTQTKSPAESPNGERSVQFVQAAEAGEQPPKDVSLFETFADLARKSEGTDLPEDFQPEPPRGEEAPGAAPLAGGDQLDRITEFFGSGQWQSVKEGCRRNLELANRQPRVRDCRHSNVVLIVIDDLGYGDLGVYGQQQIKTPNIDLLAETGVRFTNFYAGSGVGMPSHCSLMTGLHTGHTPIRGTTEEAFLPGGYTTLAEWMFKAGFETAMFGSWKLGEAHTSGSPNDQGFRETFGYLNLTHARDYFPDYLWRNEQRQPIPGNQNAREHFSLEMLTDEAVDYLTRGRRRPFFMMVSLPLPRGDLDQIPSLEPYTSEDWPREQKQYAAAVSRVDEAVGRIMDALYRRNMKENTLVILTSDNGPHKEGVNPEFFNSNGPFNGIKGTLHEGGIRVPMIVWGPSDVVRAAGSVNHHVWWAPDLMPTLLELVGAWRRPRGIDGISQLDLWRGQLPAEHRHLYWELHGEEITQAVRLGNWKGVRRGGDGAIKLYNLEDDPGEEEDVAQSHPDIVQQVAQIMEEDRHEAPNWPEQ